MQFRGTHCLFKPPTKPFEGSTESWEPPATLTVTAAKAEILQAPPIPSELDWLLDRFEIAGVFEKHQRPQYCIVNEYVEDLGISAHVENFLLGEPMVGLSMLSPVNMRFHELVKAEEGSVRSGTLAKATDWNQGGCAITRRVFVRHARRE